MVVSFSVERKYLCINPMQTEFVLQGVLHAPRAMSVRVVVIKTSRGFGFLIELHGYFDQLSSFLARLCAPHITLLVTLQLRPTVNPNFSMQAPTHAPLPSKRSRLFPMSLEIRSLSMLIPAVSPANPPFIPPGDDLSLLLQRHGMLSTAVTRASASKHAS